MTLCISVIGQILLGNSDSHFFSLALPLRIQAVAVGFTPSEGSKVPTTEYVAWNALYERKATPASHSAANSSALGYPESLLAVHPSGSYRDWTFC